MFSKISDEPPIIFIEEYSIIFIGEYPVIFIAPQPLILDGPGSMRCSLRVQHNSYLHVIRALWSFFSVITNLLSSLFTVTPLADYYMLAGVVYQAPDLCSVINSRLVSRQSNSVNKY